MYTENFFKGGNSYDYNTCEMPQQKRTIVNYSIVYYSLLYF